MHQTQWSAERPLPPPVSLTSQSHHEKPPEVTCTSRGTPGCPASTRERPRETFFNTSRGQIPLPWLGSNDALPVAGQLYFMYATMLIAVPTGVKVFNWVATMFRGSLTFETPMLWATGFIFVFTIGGFTGLIVAIVPIDVQVQDTYYVVAPFHYVLVAGSLFALFAGAYYWLPKWTGHMYDETLGKWHFWLSMISFNIAFFPQHFLGLAGMPRRIPDYATQFTDFNEVSTVGAFGFGLSQLILVWVVLKCIRGGEK